MNELEIRPARVADLELLTQAFGQGYFFAERFAGQQECRGVLFTAWKRGCPRGDVYLRLEPAEEPEIRLRLPGVPFLTHLEVLAGHRNRGIGTKLIRAGERYLRDLGHRRVGLAVELTNLDAARLYRRLGYSAWGFGPVVCYDLPDGDRAVRLAQRCDVLVKRIRG
ncbi:MAG TPA: GNAT family N-acetyltransferase [Actinophytocola sp.]|uniref:GNAT family N-acetyltransferase n=1 Tax=Actinophytocola sp. TaxID=1872138 RepID=UPI002DB924A2|nr:GNAT family N-acetyltransferase [Actinophytocola sp.]HEU5470817.1 GNAT family N-acetyltransferase [Actinophytocola sp.]